MHCEWIYHVSILLLLLHVLTGKLFFFEFRDALFFKCCRELAKFCKITGNLAYEYLIAVEDHLSDHLRELSGHPLMGASHAL